MDFKEIVKGRYAAKSFSEKRVSDGDFDQLLEMVRLSASSFGIQPFIVYVVTDRDHLQELQTVSFNQPQVGSCSHLLVFCAMKNVDARIAGYEQLMKNAQMPPEKIKGYMDIVRGYMGRMSSEEIFAWSSKQTYIALDVGMHAATSLGFDSCPMEGFNAADYSKILEIPEDHVPVVLLPVGYASDSPKPKLRFSKEDLFKSLS